MVVCPSNRPKFDVNSPVAVAVPKDGRLVVICVIFQGKQLRVFVLMAPIVTVVMPTKYSLVSLLNAALRHQTLKLDLDDFENITKCETRSGLAF